MGRLFPFPSHLFACGCLASHPLSEDRSRTLYANQAATPPGQLLCGVMRHAICPIRLFPTADSSPLCLFGALANLSN